MFVCIYQRVYVCLCVFVCQHLHLCACAPIFWAVGIRVYHLQCSINLVSLHLQGNWTPFKMDLALSHSASPSITETHTQSFGRPSAECSRLKHIKVPFKTRTRLERINFTPVLRLLPNLRSVAIAATKVTRIGFCSCSVYFPLLYFGF